MTELKKTNIKSARFTTENNDTIEIVYWKGRGKNKKFYAHVMPVQPTNTKEWKILKDAGWDFEAIQEYTVDWKKAFSKSYNEMIMRSLKLKEEEQWKRIHEENDTVFKQLVSDEKKKWEMLATDEKKKWELLAIEEKARLQKWSNEQIEAHKKMNDEEKRKFEEEQTKLYEGRIAHITADINNNSGDAVEQIFHNKLYDILTSDIGKDDEMVFKFKVKALEDKSNFKGLNKTEEKTKRRQIRKATTIREIIGIL